MSNGNGNGNGSSKTKTDIFQISADELQSRTAQKEAEHDDPCKKAVQILEAAVDRVLSSLGVNVEDVDTIHQQMDQLGIVMTENTEENTPKLNGFYIYLYRKEELIPYSWVGAARINHLGECFCDINYFNDNRLEEVGGVRLIK